jgi:hypothetical protein
MSAEVVPLRPKPKRAPSRAELVKRVHELAGQGRIGWEHPHVKERMAQRGVTMRQVLEVARSGEGISGPTLDQWGDWRVKLKKYVAGRRVQIVAAVKDEMVVVVTVI